ncbi:hypothetical protein ACOMHN_064006 [Nucella lapillus]
MPPAFTSSDAETPPDSLRRPRVFSTGHPEVTPDQLSWPHAFSTADMQATPSIHTNGPRLSETQMHNMKYLAFQLSLLPGSSQGAEGGDPAMADIWGQPCTPLPGQPRTADETGRRPGIERLLWDGQKMSDTNPEKPPANSPKSSEEYSLWSPPTHTSLKESPRGDSPAFIIRVETLPDPVASTAYLEATPDSLALTMPPAFTSSHAETPPDSLRRPHVFSNAHPEVTPDQLSWPYAFSTADMQATPSIHTNGPRLSKTQTHNMKYLAFQLSLLPGSSQGAEGGDPAMADIWGQPCTPLPGQPRTADETGRRPGIERYGIIGMSERSHTGPNERNHINYLDEHSHGAGIEQTQQQSPSDPHEQWPKNPRDRWLMAVNNRKEELDRNRLRFTGHWPPRWRKDGQHPGVDEQRHMAPVDSNKGQTPYDARADSKRTEGQDTKGPGEQGVHRHDLLPPPLLPPPAHPAPFPLLSAAHHSPPDQSQESKKRRALGERRFLLPPCDPCRKLILRGPFGEPGEKEGQFNEANGIATFAGKRVAIADTNNCRIQFGDLQHAHGMYHHMTSFRTRWGDYPNKVACVGSNRFVVCFRKPTPLLKIFNTSGRELSTFGEGQLQFPRGLAVDEHQNIFVLENWRNKVHRFEPQGSDCYQRKKTFKCRAEFPVDIAVHQGRVLVVDNRRHQIIAYNYCGMELAVMGHKGLTNYPVKVLINSWGHVMVVSNHDCLHVNILDQAGHPLTYFRTDTKQEECLDIALVEDGRGMTFVMTCADDRIRAYTLPAGDRTSPLPVGDSGYCSPSAQRPQ